MGDRIAGSGGRPVVMIFSACFFLTPRVGYTWTVVYSTSISAASGAINPQNIGFTIFNLAFNGKSTISCSPSSNSPSTCPASAGRGRRNAYVNNSVTGNSPIADIVAFGLMPSVDVQNVYTNAPSKPADPPPVLYPPNAEALPIDAG